MAISPQCTDAEFEFATYRRGIRSRKRSQENVGRTLFFHLGLKSSHAAMKEGRISALVHNFLGTFASRNSDFEGYWLFGFLVRDSAGITIDLLGSHPTDDLSPRGFARKLAIQRFQEQAAKAGIRLDCLRQAHLRISKVTDRVYGLVGGRRAAGFRVLIEVQVMHDSKNALARSVSIFVAPHNPRIESRRAGFH